jgi:hypothetical protein
VKNALALQISAPSEVLRRPATVRQLGEVVGEGVWAEVVQDCQNDFGGSAEVLREDKLGGSA